MLQLIKQSIKTTVRYHLTLVRMTIIKNSTNSKWWKGSGEKGILLHCWWERIVTIENSMKVRQKSKNRITICSSNPTPGYIFRQYSNSKRYMQSYVHSTNIHNSQDMEMSINRWMEKEVVHIYNGILLSHKKEFKNAICSIMDEPKDYHTKCSHSEKERKIPYVITYTWNL